MKILPLSDIHGLPHVLDYVLREIPRKDFDLVTVSGDIWEGGSSGGVDFWKDFQSQIKRPIVMIQGNHDFWPNTAFDGVKDIHLLHNSEITIKGVRIFGTPYTVNFCDWNWMNSEEALLELWQNSIPDKLDVLLSHGPPYNYCDNCNQAVYSNDQFTHLGSKSLSQVIYEKNPRYVFCGHIHTGDRYAVMHNGTQVFNVSCLDESYAFMGFNPPPRVVEIV